MKPWWDISWYLGSRLASAGLSIGLFALIASHYPSTAAKAILFFSFVFGFLIATLRTLHGLAANLPGANSRSRRLHRSIHAWRQLLLAAPILTALSVALFYVHPIKLPTILFATTIAVACGWDVDLIRASVGRNPLLAPLIAAGGLISIAYLFFIPKRSIDAGVLVFVLQWLPVALSSIWLWGRVALKRARLKHTRVLKVTIVPLLGPLVVAIFDGAVLNAPYLMALDLRSEAGVELAVATRVFVAALPLFPLITHWSYSGQLMRKARQLRLAEPTLYSALQGGSGLLIGSAFSALFALLNKQMTGTAYLLFVALLAGYVCHAATARFISPDLTIRARLAIYGGTLLVLYGALAAASQRWALGASAVVAIQALMLTLAAGIAALSHRWALSRPVNVRC